MYRLLQFSGSNVRSQLTSFKNICENVEMSCSRCQSCGILLESVRSQSTQPDIEQSQKKRRKRKMKFAELLVVTENSLSQQRASVQKLTSNDLKLLATTNFNLGELYKLKTLSKNITHLGEHTFNNWNFMGSVPNVSASMELPSIEPPPLQIITEGDHKQTVEDKYEYFVENESVNSVKVENVFQAATAEEEEEEEMEKKSTDEKKQFNQAYAQAITCKTLAAYGDICSVLKNPQRGLNALHFSKNKGKFRKQTPIILTNVNVYNSIMKGFAQKGDYYKIKEVISLMKEADVTRDFQSHIYVLECLGRINTNDSHQTEIKEYVDEMLKNGITFNDIMIKGAFYEGQRDMVLMAMNVYTNSYKPKYLKPTLHYSNHLVNHLNNNNNKYEATYSDESGLFTEESIVKATKKQLDLEKVGYVTVKSIVSKGSVSEEVLRYRETLQDHYSMWEKDATKAFNRDLMVLSAKRSALNMEPYLRCIPVKDFVSIIVEEAKKMSQGSETYSPTVTMLYRELGHKVYARYRVLNKEKTGVLNKILQIHSLYCQQYSALHPELDVIPSGEVKINTRQLWQNIEHKLKKTGSTLNMDHQEWVPTTLKFIGKFLYHIVMHDLKVDVNSMKNLPNKNFIPAFYTIFRMQKRTSKEEVKPHPVLAKLYRESVSEYLTFPTCELPMICPPVPWSSPIIGGYLISPAELIRLPMHANSQKQKMLDVNVSQIYPSLDALNQLSAVPWKVNAKILDVILEVFNQGGSASLDVPESPATLSPPPSPTPEMDKSQRFQLFRQKMQYRRKKGEMYSLWCDCLYRLSLANHFRNDIFWLPHNMDFRGRVYPIPPHLSHMGSDLARSILVFAESRPLGPEGLKWLKLHLVNLTGLKKRDSIDERLKFAEEILELILDSADNPLTGKRWWAESDEPWQTLACCMEIADAIRSPDPEKYRSHFPIHQDGSCNGLQHYAALGRDTAGAISVNLAPCDEPQDVYSAVAALVEQQRAKDEEAGIEVAKVLKGFVKRKVIKQTVMTTVYGVTRYGAKLQIAKQLKDIDDFPKDYIWLASSYLTGRTFDSIASMFTSTREIQDWFTECARLISQVGGQLVEWVTPLGLPVVQPYFKHKNASSPIFESFPIDNYAKPNVMKQKNAFPPNFIHSLDSSHMMLTSLHCERAGITFVSVHDCYWTHPSTTHIMNKICREQFVALHSQPILDDLSEFLAEKYSYRESDFCDDDSFCDLTKIKLNRILRKLPKTGNFDIKQVLESTFFFS